MIHLLILIGEGFAALCIAVAVLDPLVATATSEDRQQDRQNIGNHPS